jgi:ISXO2-like transposase domain/Transposase zinc-ribbon domain
LILGDDHEILEFFREAAMADVIEELATIKTVAEMTKAFGDEARCRRLLERMVWPRGRICPSCGYRRSVALADRELGRRARPGLYQCSNGDCRMQFTATTRTPLHSTKLPIRTWLAGLWFVLQSDKGISSIRLSEALGVSQPTAWRMGHVLRLLVARDHVLDGTIEIDEFHFGGAPRRDPDQPKPGRGRKGQPKTIKTPALAIVQRPNALEPGSPAGEARATVVADRSLNEVERVLEVAVDPAAHLMSDEEKAFVAVGTAFRAHDTVRHSQREYVRGPIHANSAEGFNDRIRRTIVGVFHHISPALADLYFNEIGFRWSQRLVSRRTERRNRKGRVVVRTLWDRIPPALQLPTVFRRAVGRQLRRSPLGGIVLISDLAVFG